MVRLSNRQYPMLRAFIELHYNGFMSVEYAQKYDQRPFRSMLIQEWISYKPGHGFHITKKGREAWREFGNTEIWRTNPMRPLTAYFDPDVYGLHEVAKGRRKAAAR